VLLEILFSVIFNELNYLPSFQHNSEFYFFSPLKVLRMVEKNLFLKAADVHKPDSWSKHTTVLN
jgi:hypothetical protein